MQAYVDALAGGACHQFNLAPCCLLTYINAKRNPHKVRILEFDSGALVSVIQQHVEACRFEFLG